MTSTLIAELPDDMIIDASKLDISTAIGQGTCTNSIDLVQCKLIYILVYAGEFGIVYKGLLRRDGASEVVAVKSLKGTVVHITSKLRHVTEIV